MRGEAYSVPTVLLDWSQPPPHPLNDYRYFLSVQASTYFKRTKQYSTRLNLWLANQTSQICFLNHSIPLFTRHTNLDSYCLQTCICLVKTVTQTARPVWKRATLSLSLTILWIWMAVLLLLWITTTFSICDQLKLASVSWIWMFENLPYVHFKIDLTVQCLATRGVQMFLGKCPVDSMILTITQTLFGWMNELKQMSIQGWALGLVFAVVT